MSVEIARGVGPAHVDVAYERFGEPDLPPVLLLMGLGTQMLGWPDGFCYALAERGVHSARDLLLRLPLRRPQPSSSNQRLVLALATPGVNRFSVVLLPARELQKRFLQKNETHPGN